MKQGLRSATPVSFIQILHKKLTFVLTQINVLKIWQK